MATTATSREERIEAQLKALPAKPGVYLFRGGNDAVLYVGRAKSLRSRVRSYFRGGDTRQGLDRLTSRIERIEVILTTTEAEAYHLEQNLIRRHRPPFNVRLRDDKSYPYIAVTVDDDYPRVMFTRERHRRDGEPVPSKPQPRSSHQPGILDAARGRRDGSPPLVSTSG